MLRVFIGAVLMLTGCILSYRNGYNDAVRDTEERWAHAVAMKADCDAR